jgi:uncharacterized membrane protein (UPF0136 family)
MSLTAFVSAALPLSLRAARPAAMTSPASSVRGAAVYAQPRRAALAVARSPTMSIAPATTRALIAAYGVVVAGGGVGAFLKTQSKMSIISGVGSGALLAAAFATENTPLALGTAVALSAVFAVRLIKTKKAMPSGALMALSLIFAAVFGYSIFV